MNVSQDCRKLMAIYAEQERIIRERKAKVNFHKAEISKLRSDSNALRGEVKKLFPEKLDGVENEKPVEGESSSGEDDSPMFIAVERIYSKEISVLKKGKRSLKQDISQLLKILNRDVEEDYSSDEWEGAPSNKSPAKLTVLTPSISIWEPIPYNDDYRLPIAYKSGGLPLLDEAIQNKIRSVGKELVREIGRKLLNGDFNLTRISVPIKCMQASTALHNTLKSAILCPPYLIHAGSISDPIERLKLVVASSIGSFYYLSTFEKPINPVLGETLFGVLEDGSEMFAEQSCHHPPVSHFYIDNPLYRLTGYYNFSAKAGLNSVTVTNLGKKTFTFNDGHTISQNCGEDIFGGTFFGTLRHDCHGEYIFTDHTYGNICKVKIGIKNKHSDYFEGGIWSKTGASISKVTGTWIGYLDFDNVRYWDVRHIKPSAIKFTPNLPSDSELRHDLKLLRNGKVDEAQVAKEENENLQRHDRKMREKFHPH